jgi:hypothetical protein
MADNKEDFYKQEFYKQFASVMQYIIDTKILNDRNIETYYLKYMERLQEYFSCNCEYIEEEE